MAKTILFVDEEQYVHKALQRSFRDMRKDWDMRFSANPREAVQTLSTTAVDVLITETVFAEYNGLEFLKAIRNKLPHIVRIILSGYADRDIVLKSVDLAHQYLAKPCEDDTLRETISRAFMMKELLDTEALKEIISRIDELPSLPENYLQLVDELKSADPSVQKVADIIARDLGLTTKVLKLVNSSFFGMPQSVSNPAKAVTLLGLDLIKAIVLTSGILKKFRKLNNHGLPLNAMWDHAMRTAVIARTIAQQIGIEPKKTDQIFMAGMLHDIGKLLIAAYLPEKFAQILKTMRITGTTMTTAEVEVLGATHAVIGAYLLGLWSLPDAIVEATAFHHTPEARQAGQDSPTLIVHVANAFANSKSPLASMDAADGPQAIFDDLDYAYLEQIKALESIEHWRKACAGHLRTLP